MEDRLQARGGAGWILGGEKPTLVDLQLFATLIRFDSAYHTRFRMAHHHLYDGTYPQLWVYTRRMLAMPVMRRCVSFGGIQAMYYLSEPLHRKAARTVAPLPRGLVESLEAPIEMPSRPPVKMLCMAAVVAAAAAIAAVATVVRAKR